METGTRRVTVCIVLVLGSLLFIHPASAAVGSAYSTLVPTQHQPNRIIATSNEELAQYSTSGTGIQNDPYILRDFEVVSSDSCLDIQDTDAYFVMSGCILICTANLTPAIFLSEVQNGAIVNCSIRARNNGVECYSSVNISITNCRIYGSFRGIYLEDSSSCDIQDCKIFSNTVGLLLRNGDSSEIISNSIYSNSYIGLYIDQDSDNNTIYLNRFGFNDEPHAVAHGANNQFYHDSGIGNAWSDYNHSQEYIIIGIGNFTDPYAEILVDSAYPVIDSPNDMIIGVDGNNQTITWSPSDEFPLSYTITVDDVVSQEDHWDGGNITYSLSQLSVGTHIIELKVSDAVENTAMDEILISVVIIMLNELGTTYLVIGSLTAVAILFISIIIIKKRD